MPSNTIGFAIIGPGVVADYHQQAIEANADLGARLVAIGHHNPAKYSQLGRQFGVPCQSLQDVLANPEVDVVCICTPSGQHAAQTIAAAKAGKHVLVEKPMALSLADADAMIDACNRAGVKLGITFQRRYEPYFNRIQQAITAGDFGDLTLGIVTIPYHRPQDYFNLADWRGTWALDGGGVLMNQGIHLVDLLVWYMGDPIEVQAYANTLHRDIEVEDVLAATLHFDNGSMATITATTTAAPGFPHRVEIYGTDGGVQVEGAAVGQWTLVNPTLAKVEPYATGGALAAGAGSDPKGEGAANHIALFPDFIVALQNNAPAPIDGAEGPRGE